MHIKVKDYNQDGKVIDEINDAVSIAIDGDILSILTKEWEFKNIIIEKGMFVYAGENL